MSESNSTDVINIDLGKLNKSEIILSLLEILECTSLLLEREDETLKTKEEISELILKAKKISDYFTKLVESEKHELKKNELLKPIPITEALDGLMTLTKTVENILEEKEEFLELTTLIMRSIIRLNVRLKIIDYKESRKI